MPNALAERLRTHLEATGLLAGPARVLLAVSGGADSIAMLDLFAVLGPDLGLEPCVVHADHGIHPDSGRVALMVADLVRDRYGLEVEVGRLSLGAGAGETRARRERYRLFREVQAARGARYLATAHHADDLAETVLMRLLRGSAPAGLAGIPARGPRGLVRPLLWARRADLAAHVRAAGLPSWDDPANADPRHTRSWLRTAVLPVLEARLGAAAVDALVGAARHARREVAAWDAALAQLPGLDVRRVSGGVSVARDALRGYDDALAGRVLRAAARRAGLAFGPAGAERLARFAKGAASGRRLALGAAVEAEASFDRLIIARPGAVPPAEVLGADRGQVSFGPWRFQWTTAAAPAALERGGWTTWLTPGALTVRSPSPGDRLAPLGGTGRRRVARLLMEARVPRRLRTGYPVLLRDREVLWIPGVCRAGAAVPEPGSLAVRVDASAV